MPTSNAAADVPFDVAAGGSNSVNDSNSNSSSRNKTNGGSCLDDVATAATANIIHSRAAAKTEEFLLTGLQRLDHHYQEMWEQQRILIQALESLEKDEWMLEEALVKIQEQPAAKRKPQQNKDAQALQRLQQALLAAGSSSEDDDSDDDDDDDSDGI
jgi:CHASE3 domain sensor protein